MREILIDLRTSLSARAFAENESFYPEELTEAVNRFKDILETVKSHAEVVSQGRDSEEISFQKNTLHIHEVLAILGERGIGKTSFLLSLCKEISNIENVYILPIVDPTLIENAELFLVTVISNIHEAVEKRLKKSPFSQAEEKFKKTFHELAQCLRVLSGGSYLKEIAVEAEIFAWEALKEAKSGTKLAQFCRDFCDAALKVLGKDYFVLPIDDIDMMLSRGHEILETIRKYLSNDKIIVILSGYYDLYYYLLKLDFFKQLLASKDSRIEKVPEILKKEEEHVFGLIDDLTWQYLLKLVPYYNRIHLFGVNRKIWENRINVRVKHIVENDRDSGNRELLTSFEEIFRRFSESFFFLSSERGNSRKRDILNPQKWPPALILPAAARGFVNLLKILVKNYQESSPSFEVLGEIYKKILSVFTSNFQKIEADFLYKDLLNVMSLSHLGQLSVDLFRIREKLGIRYWLMEPEHDPFSKESETLNQIYILLQMGINISFRKRKVFLLDFINRIALAQEIIADSENLQKKDMNFVKNVLLLSDVKESLNLLISHRPTTPPDWGPGYLFLTKKRQKCGQSRIFNTMIHLTYIYDKENRYKELGNLRFIREVYRQISPELQDRVFNSVRNNDLTEIKRIFTDPSLFPAVENWRKRADEVACWFLDFFSALFYPLKPGLGSYWTVSIFSGLANLQRILDCEDREDCEDWRTLLPPYIPMEGASKDEEAEEEVEDELLEGRRSSLPNEWIEVIWEWCGWFKEGIPRLPAPVLSRAAHRFYQNLKTLKDELNPWERSLGIMLSRWVLAFWQALLAEEYAFYTGRAVYIPNIVRTLGIFEREEWEVYLEKTEFAKAFLYCPILLGVIPEELRQRLLERERPTFIPDNFQNLCKIKYRIGESETGQELDLHTALCALFASIRSPGRDVTEDDLLTTFARNIRTFILKYEC